MRSRANIRIRVGDTLAMAAFAATVIVGGIGVLGFVGCGLWWISAADDFTGQGGNAGLAFGLALGFGVLALTAGGVGVHLAPDDGGRRELAEARQRRIWWSELRRSRARRDRGDRPWDRFDIWVERDGAEVTLVVLRARGWTRGRVVDVVHSARLAGTDAVLAAEVLWDLRRRARQAELDSEAEWRLRRQVVEAQQRRQRDRELEEHHRLESEQYARATRELLERQEAEQQQREAITEAEGLARALSEQNRRRR